MFSSLSVVPQLEEANDLLRAESDTAARLRKSHTEMAKSMSQLESLNRELQERSRAIDGEKAQLEKEVLLIQSTLDSERRNYSQGSEEIRELQGEKSNPRISVYVTVGFELKRYQFSLKR